MSLYVPGENTSLLVYPIYRIKYCNVSGCFLCPCHKSQDSVCSCRSNQGDVTLTSVTYCGRGVRVVFGGCHLWGRCARYEDERVEIPISTLQLKSTGMIDAHTRVRVRTKSAPPFKEVSSAHVWWACRECIIISLLASFAPDTCVCSGGSRIS